MDEKGIAELEGIADEVVDANGENATEHDKPDDAGKGDDNKENVDEGAEEGDEKSQATDWEISAPDDFQIPQDNLKSFAEAAKKCGMTKEQADAMLDWHKNFHNEATRFMEQNQANTIKAWREEMAKDQDFGGANYKSTVAEARRALAEFDEDGSVRKLLRETGQQENPAIIRLVARVGRAMGEHKFISANGGGKNAGKPLHERMYPEMKVEG